MGIVEASTLALASLLSEFGSAPGNFPVRLREPSELYDQLETVAAWALGKLPVELAERSDALRAAAVLFVQRACFAPGNNHYEVLGLRVGALDHEALRSRYRALIRLTHPDMGVVGLPATAAGTVNRAYEVLSDADMRSRYDEVLRKRDGIVHPPVEAAVKRIELNASLGERWQSLVASHPVLMRTGLTVGIVGLLGAAVVSWMAVSSTGGSSMIVARARVPGDASDPAPATRTQRPAQRDSFAMSTSTGSANWKLPESRPAPATISAKDAPISNAPVPPRGASALPAQMTATTSSLPAAAPPAPPPAPPVTTPLKHLGNIFGWSEQRATESDPTLSTAASSPAAVSLPSAGTSNAANQSPVAATVTISRTVPSASPANAPPAVSTTQTVAARNTASGGTGSSGPNATFPVDAARAKTYLTDIVMSLERPSNARSTNAYLSEMNVQGSLLQPALQLMRKYPEINIENMNWQDNLRPGVMKVQGVVVMTARSSSPGEARKVAFQLNAEFWGLRDGTFLASLNMKEED